MCCLKKIIFGFKRDVTWHWNMLKVNTGLMFRNFYQSHVLYAHCIVSFECPCHSNTGNSPRGLLMHWAINAKQHLLNVHVAPTFRHKAHANTGRTTSQIWPSHFYTFTFSFTTLLMLPPHLNNPIHEALFASRIQISDSFCTYSGTLQDLTEYTHSVCFTLCHICAWQQSS